jgi:hypothetical protein
MKQTQAVITAVLLFTGAAFGFAQDAALELSARVPGAAERRELPLNVNIIVDMGASMKAGKASAVQWLNDTLVDRMLTTGDRVTVFAAGARREQLYQAVIAEGNVEKDALHALFLALPEPGGDGDISAALRSAVANALQGNTPAWTLLITGPGASGTENSGDELLRYSSVRHYAAWRCITVALGMDQTVARAAERAYAGR